MQDGKVIVLEDDVGKVKMTSVEEERWLEYSEREFIKIVMTSNDIGGILVVLDATVGISPKIREYSILCKQFNISNSIFWIKNCRSVLQEAEIKIELERILYDYGLEKECFIYTENDFSKEEMIMQLLEKGNTIDLEEKQLPMILENYGIRNFINTYHKTRPLFRKLDK